MDNPPFFPKSKVPPSAVECEASVLGGVMLNKEAIETVASILSEQDFYTSINQDIYRIILELYRHGNPYDLVAVASYMGKQNREFFEDDKAYLAEVVKNTAGSANIEYYARTVKECAVLRGLIKTCNEIEESCYHQGMDAKQIVDKAEAKIHEISGFSSESNKPFSTAQEVVAQAIDKLDELFNSDSTITGVETGFTEIDEITSGLQEGDLIIVAGRPSMGKTSFAMNIAEKVGIIDQKYSAVFSLEMPKAQLINRMLSSIGKISSENIRRGSLTGQDWPKLNKAVNLISASNLFFNDQGGLTISQLRNFSRRMDREARKKQEERKEKVRGLDLIVVDYLQLMSSEKENRTQEISDISRGLKHLAKELSVPLIALSQLNRALEARPNKRPIMSDLRESGAIEQDADLIFFIYRDEVYNPESDDKGSAEIILAKHRNGPLNNFKLDFIGEYTRFENKENSTF